MNSKGHLYISLIKSVLRILGCLYVIVINNNLVVLAGAFLIAEVLGIMEELFDER